MIWLDHVQVGIFMLVFLLTLHLLSTLCLVKCFYIHTDSESTVLVLRVFVFVGESEATVL